MIEQRIDTKRASPFRRPCPDDFTHRFIRLGRLLAQEHYGVGRPTINRWLEESGKDELIEKRAEYVRSYLSKDECREPFLQALETSPDVESACKAARVSVSMAYKWRKDSDFARSWKDRRANRQAKSHPLIVHHAAQYLRKVRNGGWIVSPAPNGEWRVGTRRYSAADLVAFAKSKGFDPANLSRGSDEG